MTNENTAARASSWPYFPFAMIMFSFLVKGAMFLFLNGPFIILLLLGKSFNGFQNLFQEGIIPLLANAKGGILSVSILVGACTLIGFLVSPFERLTCVIAVGTVRICLPVLSRVGFKRHFFSPIDFRQEGALNLEHWLVKNPAEKSYWEWGLLLYNLWWSMFFNISLSVIALLLLIWPSLSWPVSTVLGLTWLLYLFFALDRSTAMAEVYAFYLKKACTKK